MNTITFKCTECDKIFYKQEEEIIFREGMVQCPYCGVKKYIGQFSPILEKEINKRQKQEE